MSTRSYICIEKENGDIQGVYCHSDGYLTYNGAMLIDHYNEREKVEKLISLGDLSILCENIEPDPTKPHSFDYDKRQRNVCVFYGRDRNETGTDARVVELEELDNDIWIEYIYIFGLDNKWRYFEGGKLKETGLIDVGTGLDERYKELGFPRPKNCYGYFTKPVE